MGRRTTIALASGLAVGFASFVGVAAENAATAKVEAAWRLVRNAAPKNEMRAPCDPAFPTPEWAKFVFGTSEAVVIHCTATDDMGHVFRTAAAFAPSDAPMRQEKASPALTEFGEIGARGDLQAKVEFFAVRGRKATQVTWLQGDEIISSHIALRIQNMEVMSVLIDQGLDAKDRIADIHQGYVAAWDLDALENGAKAIASAR